jgi:hypothetical protein
MHGVIRPFNFCSVIVFVLAWSSFLVQQAKAQASPSDLVSDRDAHTLTGTVVNSVTGETISRALVKIYQFPDHPQSVRNNGSGVIVGGGVTANWQRAMLTDRDGHFKFEGVPQGNTFLNATKPGFMPEKGESFSVLGQRVRAGPDALPVFVRLMSTAVIAGRVMDTNGEPVEGIEIMIYRLGLENGRKHLDDSIKLEKGNPPTLTTDEDGKFRVFGLAPGTYYVAAIPLWASDAAFDPEGPGPNGIDLASKVNGSDDPPDAGYPLTYYPEAADLSQSTPIQLSAGEEARIDLTLGRTPVVSIAGTITGSPLGGDPDLRFINQSGDRIAFAYDFDPQTGRFDASLISRGFCTIRAAGNDALGNPLHAELTLKAEANAKNIHLTLLPSPSIPIVVRVETSKSQSDVDRQDVTNPKSDASLVNVVLHPVELLRTDIPPDKDEKDPNNTSLALRNIDAGRYRVGVTSVNTSLCVKSVSYAGIDLLREELTVTQGNHSSIEVVLRDDCAALEVSTNPDDSAVVFVVVVPDYAPQNPITGAVSTVMNSTHIKLNFNRLAPGTYNVFAFDRLDGLEYTNPDALREYASKATQVSLQPNESRSIKVDVIQRGD